MINKIDFTKVEQLRKQMLLTTTDMSMFLGVSRQTYYNWVSGAYPKLTREQKVKSKLKQLLSVMVKHSWPSPDILASDQKQRYEKLLEAAGNVV